MSWSAGRGHAGWDAAAPSARRGPVNRLSVPRVPGFRGFFKGRIKSSFRTVEKRPGAGRSCCEDAAGRASTLLAPAGPEAAVLTPPPRGSAPQLGGAGTRCCGRAGGGAGSGGGIAGPAAGAGRNAAWLGTTEPAKHWRDRLFMGKVSA